MIIGAHSIIYSRDPEADRAFLRDVLRLSHVDVGHGWLIFGLPPAEVAVHPSESNDVHEFYLMCDDVDAFRQTMSKHGLTCGSVQNQGWGLLTQLILPGLSIGILLGALVIVTAWLLIWIYVRWANEHYDAALEALRKRP